MCSALGLSTVRGSCDRCWWFVGISPVCELEILRRKWRANTLSSPSVAAWAFCYTCSDSLKAITTNKKTLLLLLLLWHFFNTVCWTTVFDFEWLSLIFCFLSSCLLCKSGTIGFTGNYRNYVNLWKTQMLHNVTVRWLLCFSSADNPKEQLNWDVFNTLRVSSNTTEHSAVLNIVHIIILCPQKNITPEKTFCVNMHINIEQNKNKNLKTM